MRPPRACRPRTSHHAMHVECDEPPCTSPLSHAERTRTAAAATCRLTDQEILDNFILCVFAGQDTSASTISLVRRAPAAATSPQSGPAAQTSPALRPPPFHSPSSLARPQVMYYLAQHPAAMNELRAEQARVMDSHGQGFTAQALRDMVYTEAVVRETLRLSNVIGGVFRTAAQVGHLSPSWVQGS